ncbi:MAG TPA: helix-turn-helix domain-containing protein [Bacteroidales bacterium]|nr:helix-turn-helix domain-containing protein [Bacteroidales bacterium]
MTEPENNLEKPIKVHNCPVTYTMERIGGKWKLIIIHLISNDINRFGMMQRTIEGISKQMLTSQLRELEEDGIIERKIFAEIPPRVEYSISELGQSLLPIIEQMGKWGEVQMKGSTERSFISTHA